MRLLLDTHIFLWVVADSERLSAAARRHIVDADTVYVSAASVWEVAIKASIGRLHVDLDGLVATITASGFVPMPVSVLDAMRVRDLPFHHRDPFDRMLVAQALGGPLRLLSADAQLAAYSDLVLTV
jgi:PIN domain nuclease of toxin-antitoxin system